MREDMTEAKIKKANEFVDKFAFSKKNYLTSDVKSSLVCGAIFAWILDNFCIQEEYENLETKYAERGKRIINLEEEINDHNKDLEEFIEQVTDLTRRIKELKSAIIKEER